MWDNATTSPLEEEDGSVTLKMSALVIIFVVSFVGNTLIIVVVHRSRRNQWTTNHFVLNLAVINLLASSLCLSLTLDRVYRAQWLFGPVGCKLCAFLEHFNVFVSVGILCCMSFDRFYLTAFPLTFKLSKPQTKKIIFVIWILAASICSPLLHFYDVDSAKSVHDCSPKLSRDLQAYMCIVALLFLLAHFATYAMYLRVYLCILARNSKSAGLNRRFVSKVPRTKLKVTKLLVVHLVVHTLLWLPFVVYQTVSSTSSSVMDNLTANTLTLYIAYASSAASPVVYTAYSGDFRRGCKQMLMKYDASKAYRLPAQLERKNRVDCFTPDLASYSGDRHIFNSVKSESRTEQAHDMTSFEQPKKPKLAWSNESI